MNALVQINSKDILEWVSTLGNIHEIIFVAVLIISSIVILIATISINKSLKHILRFSFPDIAEAEDLKKKQRLPLSDRISKTWNKLLELRPIHEEKDFEIDHEYDGIKELDNPIPTWFNVLFYGTIFFGICYIFIYHVLGIGMNQDQEYEHEMRLAEIAKQEYLAQAANLIDENSVTIDLSMAPAGKSLFVANCAACHGNDGQGGIGPNLTDKYWLHGGEIADIFKTVKYGVPAKGMVPWEQTLTPGQIAEVSNYIISLRNTNPANAKQAEGVEVQYEGESTDSEVE